VSLRTFIHIESSKNGDRHLYVDAANSREILEFIQSDSRVAKKFKHISLLILEHTWTKDIFEHEPINDEAHGVYAMKLKVGLNPRIYCKTYENESGFHIILSELFRHKATTKLTKELRNIIQKVGSYEYQI
jgi:hypothetical protein